MDDLRERDQQACVLAKQYLLTIPRVTPELLERDPYKEREQTGNQNAWSAQYNKQNEANQHTKPTDYVHRTAGLALVN